MRNFKGLILGGDFTLKIEVSSMTGEANLFKLPKSSIGFSQIVYINHFLKRGKIALTETLSISNSSKL